MTDKEINYQVATQVMGWRAVCIYDGDSNYEKQAGIHPHSYDHRCGWNALKTGESFDWSPTTDPAAWMQVVERMREKGWNISLDNSGTTKGMWVCLFDRGRDAPVRVDSDLVGRAICLAALYVLNPDWQQTQVKCSNCECSHLANKCVCTVEINELGSQVGPTYIIKCKYYRAS